MAAWIEWFGTLSSVVVAVSLTMKNIRRLRLYNLVGAAGFTAYGFLIRAWPVFGLNAFIVLVDLYFLWKMRSEARDSVSFELLRVDASSDAYLERFVAYYSKDIKRFFPDFDADPRRGTFAGTECFFILRGAQPVSLVAFRKADGRDGADAELDVVVDYAVPAYRDLKNARFFFSKIARDYDGGGRPPVFFAEARDEVHAGYLRKLGFVRVDGPDGAGEKGGTREPSGRFRLSGTEVLR